METNRMSRGIGNDPGATKRPQVIALISGKGGVGKSTTAFNLAALLSRQGERCLMIDTDWYFGNLHLLANVLPTATLAEILTEPVNTRRFVTRVTGGLDLIASPSCGDEAMEFEEVPFARFLSSLRSIFHDYDFILIDTPSGTVPLISLAANAADVNLAILNPELTSIADAYGLFKYLIKGNHKIAVHFLINRATGDGEHEYIYRKLAVMAERFLGRLPYDSGYLPDDRGVMEAIAQQRPLLELAPDAPLVQRLAILGQKLRGKPGGNEPEEGQINLEKINSSEILADIRE